ncbi:MAG: hypothetical protein EA361_14055 [Bacteroidetes bacterium]|nr:MAG: hypothetical protein EA361_14055 [Bacteroidota bacterium]
MQAVENFENTKLVYINSWQKYLTASHLIIISPTGLNPTFTTVCRRKESSIKISTFDFICFFIIFRYERALLILSSVLIA